MTQENLKQLYSRQNWRAWLADIFGAQMQFEEQAENISTNKEHIKSFQRFANVQLADGKNLAVLDVETCAGVQIFRNRVGLRNLVEKYIDYTTYHGILAFYHNDTSAEYRMSFISSEPVIKEDGTFAIGGTASKRYTYLLGGSAKTKTPADRLKSIADKNGKATLEDVKNAFSVEALTKEFYSELFVWYQWALSDEIGVTYPNDRSTEKDDRQIEKHIIRLITRLIFVWFIKQKHLIPDAIFDIEKLESILINFNAHDSKQDNYYRAILQNLFFATLNNKIEDRTFAIDGTYYENRAQYGVKTRYRYAEEFSISTDEVVKMFDKVPFLNGGLFECLDKDTPDSNGKIIYCDGFSRKKDRQSRAHIPNILFFQKDKGLISLLNKYNFTIEENTPIDVEVALDPELLGKVFENLLASYNPETQTTARKQTGSFYTPREIVNYMVDESLVAYLKQVVGEQHEEILKKLFEKKIEIDISLKKQIYEALRNGKILDPACGSGAFPMGILNRIICMMQNIDYPHSIFDLKLHLIENCIYGVDIQEIAVQITKLRFFISLICEQTPNNESENNFGIKPLPNLETKFVAANTLIGLAKQEGQLGLEDPEIEATKKSLLEIRHLHFSADTAKKKKEYRDEDKKYSKKLGKLLENGNVFSSEDAKQIADWNPYNQNSSAPFFDAEWMFGVKEGFDVVIGNPPYVQLQNNGGALGKLYEKSGFKTFARSGDIYCLFYERGFELLKPQGTLCFITSNKWMRAGYGENTRKFLSENTNPSLLVDFAGVKVFESATVDTNILMFSKDKNRQQTRACVVKKDGIKELSLFVNQNATTCHFTVGSWIVLSPIEQSIKKKIESVGTPLKEWDINIYRGILTGYNEAFIIDSAKRAELIAADAKSEEIIRPILRGRDIKRYGYEWAGLWVINTHNGIKEKGIKPININDYPAIKNHLDKFYPELEKRQDKGDTPYNLRNCAYMEDFYRQKIIYSNMSSEPNFALDNDGFLTNQKCFILTGNNLNYLFAFFNSKLFKFIFNNYFPVLGEKGREMSKIFMENIPVPTTPNDFDLEDIEKSIYELYQLAEEEIQFIENQ